MPPIRVDFYLLESSEQAARALFACRFLEKAYLRGHRVFVHCNSQEEAEMLDDLLWSFKEDSFIPHNLQGEGPQNPPPIQLGYGGSARGFNDILLNYGDEVPPFFAQFKRIIELVSNDLRDKELGRAHYKVYKAKLCELFTHHIAETTA